MTTLLRFALICFAVLVAACASRIPFDKAQESGLTVNLPLSSAGVLDVRAEFNAVFKAELEKDDERRGYGNSGDYLLGSSGPTKNTEIRLGLNGHNSQLMQKTAVLVIPGIFGECVDDQALPFTDGRIRDRSISYTDAYFEHQTSLNVFSIRAVKVRGRGGSAENATVISDAINQAGLDPRIDSIVLVAYSKGVADALESLADLQKRDAVPAKLRALVSVAGIVMGTPIADSNLSLYRALVRVIPLSTCDSSGGAELESLTRRIRTPWLGNTKLPSSVAMYSVVASAPREYVGPGLLPFYDALWRVNPQNDGQVIASDAILPKSSLLAVAISDHWDFVLPLRLSPNFLVRQLTSGRDYPRSALFRAIIRYVVSDQEHTSH